jgi:hypothetical protein
MGPDVLFQRLVWLLDRPARNEVMVIYLEDLADHGLTAADLGPGGRAADRWPAMQADLLRRATTVFDLR